MAAKYDLINDEAKIKTIIKIPGKTLCPATAIVLEFLTVYLPRPALKGSLW
jgi:hypothetical protein